MASYDDDLRLAHVLADAVERTSVELFGSPELEVQVDDQGRTSTQATARLDQLLAHQLHRTRPRDRVEGRTLVEEGHGERRWVLDALDGSANYVRGVPVWATLISLVVADEPVLGLVAAPALSRRWWAGGTGAWTGRTLSQARRVTTSATSELERASLTCDEISSWLFGAHGQGFTHLTDRVWRASAYGDFWSHTLVCEGAADVSLAAAADGFQLAALAPIVREAGGRMSDPWGARVVGSPGSRATTVVVTNGPLHERVLAALAPEPGPQG